MGLGARTRSSGPSLRILCMVFALCTVDKLIKYNIVKSPENGSALFVSHFCTTEVPKHHNSS